MRIGIDIDDTITDSYEAIVEFISKCYELNYDELLNERLDYIDYLMILPGCIIIYNILFQQCKIKLVFWNI